MSHKKLPFNQFLSPEEKIIESIRAKVAELERQLKLEIELSDSLKSASRMPGTGNYVSWIKEIRSSHDKLSDEQDKVKVLTDALEQVKLKAVSLADAQVIALEALATVKEGK